MGLSLVELSWSDAGGVLRPLIASGGTRSARRRSFFAELMMLSRSAWFWSGHENNDDDVELGCLWMAMAQVAELSLGHLGRLSVPRLPLHLLPSPTSSLDGTALEVAIALCVLDHLGDPLGTVVVGVFAVGKCVCQISGEGLVCLFRTKPAGMTHPMTPMADRSRASLRFGS